MTWMTCVDPFLPKNHPSEHSHAVNSFRTPGEPVYGSAADCADQQTFAAMILRDPSHQVEQIQHKYHAD